MKKPFSLSDEEKDRLERIAKYFSLNLEVLSGNLAKLESTTPHSPLYTELPVDDIHFRLLAEIGGRSLRWIPFKKEVSIKETVLGLPDDRLRRIGQLYDKWLAQGCPR